MKELLYVAHYAPAFLGGFCVIGSFLIDTKNLKSSIIFKVIPFVGGMLCLIDFFSR